MDRNLTSELAFAKQLADKATEIALRYYKTDLNFKTKSDSTPVTVADEAINQMVIDNVKERFPDDGIIGEEQSWCEDRNRLWVCDPIDGTIAFSMGEPTFMFSLALVEDGKPILAVAAGPATGDLFWATKNGGAYCNEKQISVSARPLQKAWMAFPTNLKWLYKNQAIYKEIAAKTYQTNVIHGAVFKGMLIAQGFADGAVLPETGHSWDYAAVKLIVEEAGGLMTDKDGQEHRFDQELENGVISSNRIIHEELLAIVKTF